MPVRPIDIANQHPRLRLDRRAIRRAIAILDTHAHDFLGGCPPGELSIVFLTDDALAKLHADFLDDPTITDVITFEGDRASGVAGEICVSSDAALRQVGLDFRAGRSTRALPKKLLPAFSAELTLYVVHGWLHLAGYDDLQPGKKRIMRRAEQRAMNLVLQEDEGVPCFTFE